MDTLPDQVEQSAMSGITGLWAECATLCRVALENRRIDPKRAKKTIEDEGKLGTGFRQRAVEMLAAVTAAFVSMDLQPCDRLTTELNRRRKSKVLEFISMGDVRDVSDVKFLREEEGGGDSGRCETRHRWFI